MTEEAVSQGLLEFLRREFLNGDAKRELRLDSPVLEWGVLTSINTVQLLSFIRAEFGLAVPPAALSARNFKDVRSMTALITGLGAALEPAATSLAMDGSPDA